MLHRLADGLRRFFKFSSGKNRLPVQPFARPVSGQEGIEKISEGDKCEPKGSQKSYELEVADTIKTSTNIEGMKIQAISPIAIFSNLVANLSLK